MSANERLKWVCGEDGEHARIQSIYVYIGTNERGLCTNIEIHTNTYCMYVCDAHTRTLYTIYILKGAVILLQSVASPYHSTFHMQDNSGSRAHIRIYIYKLVYSLSVAPILRAHEHKYSTHVVDKCTMSTGVIWNGNSPDRWWLKLWLIDTTKRSSVLRARK